MNEPLDGLLKELDFDAEHLKFPMPFSAELERSVVRTEAFWLPRMFDLPSPGLAIDIGCGYGRSESWMKDRFDAVIGIDISEHIIDKCRATFAGIDRVSFHTTSGDGFPPQVQDDSADFIYAFTVLQHIPRDQTANDVREAAGKLKRGGLFVFNLISGANEQADDGAYGVEWMIGYAQEDAAALVTNAGLLMEKTARWSAAGAPAHWLWVAARKP